VGGANTRSASNLSARRDEGHLFPAMGKAERAMARSGGDKRLPTTAYDGFLGSKILVQVGAATMAQAEAILSAKV